MNITHLSDSEQKEIYRLYKFYRREAHKCNSEKAYLAGCIMLGSALEALLAAFVNIYPEEAIATGVYPTLGKKKKVKPILKCDLWELIKVARHAGWLPYGLEVNVDAWDHKKAKIGDYACIIHEVRNYVHPGRYIREHANKRITRKHYAILADVLQYCQDWLEEHNKKSLLKHIEIAEKEQVML